MKLLIFLAFYLVGTFHLIFCQKDIFSSPAWLKPGCHKVGHTRKISIPDCVEFNVTTNACLGYCESYSVPSAPRSYMALKPFKPLTSIGQCCNIMESEDVEARVNCMDGLRRIVFKSATNCQCFHCKRL